ncbi:MAG: sugar phosphate isomerase/epimerase [Planctomycetaceae bacterium]|nr:sugar phosphate isomerase/epimerase [Planctomycetaceae bacterium]
MITGKAGVQLFTLREYTQNITDFAATMAKVRKIGYTAVQISAIGPIDPQEVAKAVEGEGLKVAATHIGWGEFLTDLPRVIEKHLLWKCPHPAIGGLPQEYFSAEGVKRFIAELTPVAAELARNGMDFSYHNHSHELIRYGPKTWLQELYDQAPGSVLKAEIDTYWIQHGGGDPTCWINHCAGREPVIHLKDMARGPDGQLMAPIGEGNLNWPAILAAGEAGGVEYYLVEQDNCNGIDPFECVATSYRNLQKLGVS